MKIFNFGLPRTGTTSLHTFFVNNEIKSLHSNDGEINQLYPKEYKKYISGKQSLLDLYISEYEAFGDLPWYSLAETILSQDNPDYYYVATYRKEEDWPSSFRSVTYWFKETRTTEMYHRYVFGKLIDNLQDENRLIDYYKWFYENLKQLADKYNKQIRILDMDNTSEIVEQLGEVITIKDRNYPHKNIRKKRK